MVGSIRGIRPAGDTGHGRDGLHRCGGLVGHGGLGLGVGVLDWGRMGSGSELLLNHVVVENDEERTNLAIPLGLDLTKNWLKLVWRKCDRKHPDALDVVHSLNSRVLGLGGRGELQYRPRTITDDLDLGARVRILIVLAKHPHNHEADTGLVGEPGTDGHLLRLQRLWPLVFAT